MSVMRKVHMLDLKREWEVIEVEVRQAIDGVLQSGRYIGGPEVGKFEEQIC